MRRSADFHVRDDLQRLRPTGDFAYQLLAHTRPSLCLDVGAASGATVQKMKKHAPQSRVLAFEPFPGNIPFFEQATAGIDGVVLMQLAVSNTFGVQDFHVPHVVKQSDAPASWAGMSGYSSVGFLVPDNSVINAGSTIRVDKCRLDDLVAERVGLLKIDVQGTEFDVLDGARRLIDTYGVDTIYSEFNGDQRVLELLADTGYDVFDTAYLVFDQHSLVHGMLDRPDVFPLSTGVTACSGYLGHPIPRDPFNYSAFFPPGGFQTDLFAVRRELTADVLGTIAAMSR